MDKQHLLESPSGVLWNIYIDENNHLVYSRRQNRVWSSVSLIDKFNIKDFSSTIDIDEKVHIVAQTSTKQLIYYQWNGVKWLYSIMTTIRSRFQDITFIDISSNGERIHILYHVATTLYQSVDVLYHYYGDGFDWQGGKILSFSSEDNISIRNTHWSNIHYMNLYYSQKKDDETVIYRLYFDKKDYTWSRPTSIFHIPMPIEDIQICLDGKKNEHVIGVNLHKGIYTLYYISNKNKQTTISSQPKPFMCPIIAVSNGTIYITWNIDDKIYSTTLDERGKKIDKLEEIYRDDMSLIHHITIQNNIFSISKRNWANIFSQTNIEDKLKSSYYPQIEEIQTIQKDINSLKTQIANFKIQFDDLYSLLNSLKEHIAQYEKSLYQVQLAIKKQTNDIAQLQNMPRKSYQQPLNYTVSSEDTEENLAESKNEVVDLGDTKIIIDSEE